MVCKPDQARNIGWKASAVVIAILLAGGMAAVIPPATSAQAGPHGQRPQGVDLAPLYQLKTQHGTPLVAAKLSGRPAAVFFGYTHCPDVCPTTLLEMSQHLEALGKDGDRLQVIFVTVDPERDTSAHLAEFVGSFDPRIVALTGSPIEIAAVAHRFGATYDKVTARDGSYTMDHTTKVFLLDRYGLVASHIDGKQSQRDQLQALKKLLAQ